MNADALAVAPLKLGRPDPVFTQRADGTLHVANRVALAPYPARMTDRFRYWAERAPERTVIAQRGTDGQWQRVSYGAMLERVRALAGSLAARTHLGAEHPVMVLSGNDIAHFELTLACFWAGIPIAPVSPAYSLLSSDGAKLRFLVELMTPGMVVAAGPAFARAIEVAVPAGTEVVLVEGSLPGRPAVPFETLRSGDPRRGDAAHAQVTADTIAKFLFTSGSTRSPKAVPNTHRMLCSNQQMIWQSFPWLADEPPILVDWLPWNHTFGGNHNLGIVLTHGGTLYIDDGKPTLAQFGKTIENLREIAPTVYFNVPKGWEDLALAMEQDEVLRRNFFARVQMFFYAGAALSQATWDRLDALACATRGARIPMLTGLGMTETAPASMFTTSARGSAGDIGLPCPGCEVKLVPLDGKLEARFKGPNVMSGYWRAPALTAEAFDEEGYYRTGDAVRPKNPERLLDGFVFDGRLAEDFKLSSGTFVSVGPLRAAVITAAAPYIQDVVLAGPNEDELAALIFPQIEACARLAQQGSNAPLAAVLDAPPVRAFFQSLIERLAQDATGSATRIARAVLAVEPPSLDRGEMTDKGSINQRAVLRHREDLVRALYQGRLPEAFYPHGSSTT